jgi:hypothetical protein
MVTHGSGGDIIPFVRLAASFMVRSTDLLRLRSPADLRLYYEQNGLFDQLRLECHACRLAPAR